MGWAWLRGHPHPGSSTCRDTGPHPPTLNSRYSHAAYIAYAMFEYVPWHPVDYVRVCGLSSNSIVPVDFCRTISALTCHLECTALVAVLLNMTVHIAFDMLQCIAPCNTA